MKKSLLVLCLIATLHSPAFADKDDKKPVWAPASAPPAAPSVILPGVDSVVSRLEADPDWGLMAVDWVGLMSYYAGGGSSIWMTPTGPTPLGIMLKDRLGAAARAGMPIGSALSSVIDGPIVPSGIEQASELEAKFSAALVATAVGAQGLLADANSRGAAVLSEVASSNDPNLELRSQLPDYAPFWRLYGALPNHVAYVRSGGWAKVPGKEKIEPGDRSDRVTAVKNRLVFTGELAAIGTEPDLYDDVLKSAVQAFQRSHGLNDDGVIGVRTIEEMNVSPEDRLSSILLNLRRMREEGATLEPRHLIVNIPGTELRVVENGATTYFTRAIVGRTERKTPLLTSLITQVKLNPDWTVPAKIAAIDMLRHELDDPGYFAARNVHVYDSSGGEINPNAIDWHDVKKSGHFPYRLRQDPGPENALGPMKLDFKNDHAVFIHGTSAPELFAKQDRFFSSGCVRVENPLDLATFLLKDDPAWNRPHIDDVVKGGKTEFAQLPRPIPVHFVYRTAWVDEDGVMQYRRDVYKRDKKVTLPAELLSTNLIASTGGTGKSKGNGE